LAHKPILQQNEKVGNPGGLVIQSEENKAKIRRQRLDPETSSG
jgi:hypothetical protein